MNGRNRADSQKEYREGTSYLYFLTLDKQLLLGDNRFMAPETLQNIFTTRADVFSLGMTILSTICDIELPKNGDLWLKVSLFEPINKNGCEKIFLVAYRCGIVNLGSRRLTKITIRYASSNL